MKANFSKGELISEIAETVGFKSGLNFSYNKMVSFASEEGKQILNTNLVSTVGIRPEEYEDIYFEVLQGTGYAPANANPDMQYMGIKLFNMYKDDKEKQDIALKIYEQYGKWIKSEMDRLIKNNNMQYGMSISPKPYVVDCYKKYGTFGYITAMQILSNQINYQNFSPWYNTRRIDWKDKIELEDLFKKESLHTYYGSFIDQRYIDYLSNNLDDIGEIHWRKFEGLTAEFFKKEGYEVTLGSGRNDGGIDVRVWKDKEDKENPPMILIQCKRQKNKVKREIVKALWADVEYEKAKSGLIVTSSEVSSGAKEDCKVRGYNINFAERDTLKRWIKSMRSKDVEIIV